MFFGRKWDHPHPNFPTISKLITRHSIPLLLSAPLLAPPASGANPAAARTSPETLHLFETGLRTLMRASACPAWSSSRGGAARRLQSASACSIQSCARQCVPLHAGPGTLLPSSSRRDRPPSTHGQPVVGPHHTPAPSAFEVLGHPDQGRRQMRRHIRRSRANDDPAARLEFARQQRRIDHIRGRRGHPQRTPPAADHTDNRL